MPTGATSSPPRCGSCPASCTSVTAAYFASHSPMKPCPRSSTHPSKSCSVIRFGQLSTWLFGWSSRTAAVSSTTFSADPSDSEYGASAPLYSAVLYCTTTAPPARAKAVTCAVTPARSACAAYARTPITSASYPANLPVDMSTTDTSVAAIPICRKAFSTASPVPGRYATFSPVGTLTSTPRTRVAAAWYRSSFVIPG